MSFILTFWTRQPTDNTPYMCVWGPEHEPNTNIAV